MNYTHLTREKCYQIYVLRKAGHSLTSAARLLGHTPGTLSRECRRNRGRRGYRPRQA